MKVSLKWGMKVWGFCWMNVEQWPGGKLERDGRQSGLRWWWLDCKLCEVDRDDLEAPGRQAAPTCQWYLCMPKQLSSSWNQDQVHWWTPRYTGSCASRWYPDSAGWLQCACGEEWATDVWRQVRGRHRNREVQLGWREVFGVLLHEQPYHHEHLL